MAGAAYGFAGMGPFWGGQAEYLRVPFGDFNLLRLPEDAQEKEADYVMLSDIFPTGWHCTRLADMQPGDSMVVYGAGPVGLMAAYSAMIQGASKVMIVDRHPDRLRLAEEIGVIPIDDSKGDPVEQVLEQTRGRGADKGCECVGYQAHDPQGHENSAHDHEPAGRFGAIHRAHRSGGHLLAAGSQRARQTGAGGEDRLRYGQVLVQGSKGRHRAGKRQALQPPAS